MIFNLLRALPVWIVCLAGALPSLADAPAAPKAVPPALVAGEVSSVGRGVLEVPLIVFGKPSAEEFPALAASVSSYQKLGDPLQTAPLEAFLAAHPRTAYGVSLWLNIALAHEHEADYGNAITALKNSLAAAGPASHLGYSPTEAVVDQTLAELLKLEVGFGDSEDAEQLLKDPRISADGGVLIYPAVLAKQTLWAAKNDPQHAYLCGLLALEAILKAQNAKVGPTDFSAVTSKDGGLSLAELQVLGKSVHEPLQAIKVAADAPIPVPSVMHWVSGHYVAVLGVQKGRYEIVDPAFGNTLFVQRSVLEANGSGFYLAPITLARNSGWRVVSSQEASTIRGGGLLSGGGDPMTGTSPQAPCNCGDNGSGSGGSGGTQWAGADAPSPDFGTPTYSIGLMLANLKISDTPVGYHPPVGPDVNFTPDYNEQYPTPSLLSSYTGNLGPQWSFNWLSGIIDNPNSLSAGATWSQPGGGSESFTYSGSSFAPGEQEGAVLSFQASPLQYTLTFRDGSERIFSKSAYSSGNQRLLLLSKIVDRFNNTAVLAYDSSNRLISVTDAIGQVTTLQYNNALFPNLITSVTDLFGRTAIIGYNNNGKLSSLTDAVGMTSTFTYASGSGLLPSTFITSMTTPYGTTTFNAQLGTSSNPYPYWLTATDPLGNTERDEAEQIAPSYPLYSENSQYIPSPSSSFTNQFLSYRNTYYWDKATYATITDQSTLASANTNVADYEKALVYHWLHLSYSNPGQGMSDVPESILYPLERNLSNLQITSRIWYLYEGQPNANSIFLGTLDSPTTISRVLANGQTQTTQKTYNSQGNVTSVVDPAGRKTIYCYATNGMDVTQASQVDTASSSTTSCTGSSKVDVLGIYTYPTSNSQHEPLTVKDAGGNTTTYTYNPAGQVTTIKNALGQTTTYGYNSQGYLTTITDANNVVKDTYTYDAVGRVASVTDDRGYALSYSYDNLNRLIKITYPDSASTGYSTQYTYTNLDITKVVDRLGRATSYTYDANRNLTSVTDPLGRVVKYGYDPDGRLISLTDADGQTTRWTRDIEGRVTAKTYPDGTSVSYTYDISGRLISRTDALQQVTNYAYTLDDRVSGVSYPNPANPTPSVNFTWDSTYPRIDAMGDGTGKTNWVYVKAGKNGALQLSSETGPVGAPAQYTYGYDALERIKQLTVAGNSLDTTTFDAIGRDTSDVTPLGQFNTAYLGETSQVTSVTALAQSVAGNPGLTSYGYLSNTGDRRLNTITYNAAPASNETITTDDADRVNQRTDGTGKVETYNYDAADRLTSGSVTAPTPAYTETYGYNNADFFNSKSGEPVTSNNWAATNTGTVNQIGSLTPNSGLGRTYTYDANGNVLSDGLRTYSWDAENRLLSVTETANGHVSSFTYDGLGRRVAITETSGGTSTTTGYLWCGSTLCSAYNSSGAQVASYQPQGETDYVNGAGTAYYYATDHLGTVTSLTNAAGTTEGTLATDAYGLTLAQSGVKSTFGYAGMFYHAPSQLYLTQYRAYDPVTGRWLSRDPAGENGGINLYGYAEQDPINEYDPLGLCPNCHTVRMETTGYDNGYGSTGKNPGDPGYGITADGQTAGPGTVAAPRNYPYGTTVNVPGYGSGTVEDRGGAIKNNHIDLWFPNDQQADKWGKRYEDVLVCTPN